MKEEVEEIIELLDQLQTDSTVPRNVKIKLGEMKKTLEDEKGELSLKVNKMLSDVEEISNDINIPMFIRTQMWNLTTLLEGLNS